PTRVSLTMPQLNRSREVWFVVSGEDKAETVATALAEGNIPAAQPKGRNRTLWLLDELAASKVS
ncbi:MAG: 6-phosphogluconolactonase, partial [Kribbellaceae bacterium]|nr:6-phosphogluconolactonase [Kribbellaceae bacterium]